MAKKASKDAVTRRMFRDPSGQGEMFEKSLEEEIEEQANKAVECLGQTFPSDTARREHFLALLRQGIEELRATLGVPFAGVDHAVKCMQSIKHWPMGDVTRLREMADLMRTAEPGKDLLQRWKDQVGFPIGQIEDILRLSDPPYYTACPNPFLGQFIKCYGSPYDPSAKYSKEPFAADVSEGKSDPIYNAHSYHTKVPHKAIMRYILHYTQPGDVVLDGFCGTGMTGLAAQDCGNPEPDFKALIERDMPEVRWGRRCSVLVDLSPAATFIARNYNSAPKPNIFASTAHAILTRCAQELGHLYRTRMDGREAAIYHTVWSDVFVCVNCSREIVFWEAAVNAKTGELAEELRCRHCRVLSHKRELSRAQETVYDPNTKKTLTRAKQVPVLVRRMCGRSRSESPPTLKDLATIAQVAHERIPDWFPTTRIDKDIDIWYERDYRSLGIYSVDQFFTRRNLRVLAALWHAAEQVEDHAIGLAIRFALTGMQVNLSRMNRWRYDVSFPYNPLSGTLYVGSLPVESNVLLGVENKVSRLKKAWNGRRHDTAFAVTTASSADLAGVPDNSIDYIFIDPPFGSNIIYSDLSIIWESWLRLFANTSAEAVVHRRKKEHAFTLENYTSLMAACLRRMYAALKPGRWITVEFQ